MELMKKLLKNLQKATANWVILSSGLILQKIVFKGNAPKLHSLFHLFRKKHKLVSKKEGFSC